MYRKKPHGIQDIVMDRYYKLSELARASGITHETLRRMTELGHLDFIQLRENGWRMVLGRDFVRFIRGRRRHSSLAS